MHEGARTGSITYSARTVGGGAGSRVPATEERPPHMFRQRSIGPCTRYRSAGLPPVATARRATTACYVARYGCIMRIRHGGLRALRK